jgi:alkylation response protein AidB-like acyl-CoA dehydrogenase
MLEIIVVGFAVLLMVLPVISTVARLTEANATAHAAARDSAVWIARHGGEPPEVEGIELTIVRRAGTVEVYAVQEVRLFGVGGSAVGTVIHSRVEVPVSQYRSTP